MSAGESVTDGLIVRGRPPFAMTPTSLLRNPAISSHAVRLWSVLASYTYGDQATDRPSRSRLAADVGWKSSRSVDTYLAELQDAGYLTVQRRWRPDGGKARNLYILEWEPPDRSTSDGSEEPHPVDDSVSAAQTHAQDPAHTHEQNPAHLGKEPTTKKEQPPADRGRTAFRPDIPPTTGPATRAADSTAELDAYGASDPGSATGATASPAGHRDAANEGAGPRRRRLDGTGARDGHHRPGVERCTRRRRHRLAHRPRIDGSMAYRA